MTVHAIKAWPSPFESMQIGAKTFEYRKNDRDYAVGDVLHIAEWNPTTKEYTGRLLIKRVTYILEGRFGVPEGYCVMALGSV